MRPGPYPWATNDNWAAGPPAALIGTASKTAPLAAQQADGYHAEERPSPRVFNWLLHRYHLQQQAAAKARASALTPYVTGVPTGGYTLGSVDFLLTPGSTYNSPCINSYLYDPAGTTVEEIIAPYDQFIWPVTAATLGAAGGIIGPLGGAAFTGVSSATDGLAHRLLTISGQNDLVYYNTTYAGAFGAITWTAGAPGLNWIACGSDWDTAGGGGPMFIIADNGVAGASVIWASTDGVGIVFAAVATWPGLAAAGVIRGVFHSHHPAGALGPDDTGNPTWLILSDAQALRSADGAAWTAANHGLGGTMNRYSAAYSKTSRRWVVLPDTAGPITGDVAYSDDNGATWTTIPLALQPTPIANDSMIVCDGFGTFVASDGVFTWFSVDEGLTWELLSGNAPDFLVATESPNTPIDETALVPNRIAMVNNVAGPLLQVTCTGGS